MWAVGRLSLLSSGRKPAAADSPAPTAMPARPPVAARVPERAEAPELAPARTVVVAPQVAETIPAEVATPGGPGAAPTFFQRMVRSVSGLFRSLFG